jgi:carboxyl-terminal processing protease
LAEAKKQQIHRYELQTKRVVNRNPAKLITSVAEAFAGAGLRVFVLELC